MKRPVQYRKWSLTANDLETANDPQNGPQMILDRKWSPKSTGEKLRNGIDFLGLSAKKDWLEKGKEDARPQANLYKAKKKWNKSEKDMVSTVYIFLCQLLQISLKNVSSL